MGLYILSYGVDLHQVRQLFASNNDDAFGTICATETFGYYSSQDFKGSVTTEEALRQIIYGEPYDANSAHSYGYALICMCDFLGVDLSSGTDFKLGYVTDLVDEYLEADFAIGDFLSADDLFTHALDLGLPPVDDFPIAGCLQAADLAALHQQFQHIVIDDEQVARWLAEGGKENQDKGTAYEAIQSLKYRIDYCQQYQVQLVSFCH